jgi:hypothetical protein
VENCQICTGGTCTFCMSGFTLNTSLQTCDDCAANCQFCNKNGAGKCDDYFCDSGYELDVNRNCVPAA